MGRTTRLDRLKRQLPAGPDIYKRRLHDILPFITEDMALHRATKHQQWKVRQYHKLIFGDANTPRLFSADKRVYKPSKPEHLEMAQAAGNMPPGFKDINVAFIPETGPKTRIIFTKDEMRIKTGSIDRRSRFFDTRAIIRAMREAQKYTRRNDIDAESFTVGDAENVDDAVFATLIEQIENATAGDPPGLRYQIMCGQHYYPGTGKGDLDRQSLVDHLKWLMVKYDQTISKWLAGIVVYSFTDQASAKGFESQKTFKEWQRYMNQSTKKIQSNKKKRRKLAARNKRR